MSDGPFVSFAQNAEDVVLWRALQHVSEGHYVEVGANHPRTDSVTRAFYDRGWNGITIEPVEEFAALHREQRPRDVQLRVAISDGESANVTLHAVAGTGLSSTVDAVGERHRITGRKVEDIVVPARTLEQVYSDAGWADRPVHFMVIDVEGAEAAVIRGLDLRRHRPWVLVVEATQPNSTVATHEEWEPAILAAGYEFCLFDGLSRFYVAQEHGEELAARLAYPACVLDDFVPARFDDELKRLSQQLDSTTSELEAQVIHWKRIALTEWADAVSPMRRSEVADPDADRLREELAAMHGSLSWRVTEPIRGLRRAIGRIR
ncbi:FkbM family methyltransferase [Micromonospora sp. DT81.3]|uniref:FkbM family methyltransferase n=1 Tax=Micromonospora sp. DT81.3 TaxID=3416523 RepID=UPI003CE8B887